MACQRPPDFNPVDAIGAGANFPDRHRAAKKQVPKCRRRRGSSQPCRQVTVAQMSSLKIAPKSKLATQPVENRRCRPGTGLMSQRRALVLEIWCSEAAGAAQYLRLDWLDWLA